MYKLNKNEITGKTDVVIRLEDNIYIPMVADNTDYQAFLKYQADGGKVYGADEEVPAEENQ
jgi:hypothetical protein